MNGPVRQKNSGNKEQCKAEKQKMRKRNLEESFLDTKAGGKPV